MAFLGSLRERRRQPELMDQPGLDAGEHDRALQGLERINRWSFSARIVWKPLKFAARESAGRPLRVLDVATGAGDVPIALWRRARRAGLPLQIAGCDVSPQALAFARRRAEESRAEVSFFLLDALRDDVPAGYDVVLSSLFLHHLDEGPAERFLRKVAEATGRMVLVNDLVRSARNYFTAYVVTRLLSASRVVHVDGPLSIEGAFTLSEVQALARRAGLSGASVEKRWPCRFLLCWRKA
jgi:2-polyprenyl-3-methyl-5-hydroxy-6-metoxy-1,4-benzoquinol methylase